jgi:hypothetical protein
MDGISKADKTRGKWVNLANLADGYQLIAIGCWISEMDDAGGVQSEFNEKILKELNTRNIPLVPSSELLQAPNK